VNRARTGFRIALLAIGIVFTAVWVLPAIKGPAALDCGELTVEVCEQIWRPAAAADAGIAGLLPITAIRVTSSVDNPLSCNTVYVERLIFATAVIKDC
jgi:hypothetical protein